MKKYLSLMNKYTLLLIAFMCCTLVFQGVLASEADDVVKVLSLEPHNNDATTPGEYLPSTLLTTQIKINGPALTGTALEGKTLESPYIRVEMNTGMGQYQVTDYTATADKYVDFLNSPEVGNVTSAKVTHEMIDGKSVAVLTITLGSIDPSTEAKVPYNFSLTGSLTPVDFVLQPVVKLFDKDGNLLQTLQDNQYKTIYKECVATKTVGALGGTTAPMYAGPANTANTAVAETGTAPIPFFFSLGAPAYTQYGDYRKMQYVTVTDTLPTYTDVNGVTRTAIFKPEENPGWQYVQNADGTIDQSRVTATHNYEENDPIPRKLAFLGSRWDAGTEFRTTYPLYLHFPGVPIDQNGLSTISVTNKADFSGIPYNETEAEKGLHNYTATRQFKVVSELNNLGRGLFSKINRGILQADYPMGMYLARPEYSIITNNPTGYHMGDIVITESLKPLAEQYGTYDPRLFVDTLTAYFDSVSAVVPIQKVELIKADGSVTTVEVNGKAPVSFNEAAIADLYEIAEEYRADPNATVRPVDPALIYDTVKIYLDPAYRLAPGYGITAWLKMAFRDPYNVDLNEPTKTINNTANLEANLYQTADSAEVILPVNTKSLAEKTVRLLNEKLTLR